MKTTWGLPSEEDRAQLAEVERIKAEEATRFEAALTVATAHCKRCPAEVVWVTSPKEKRMPVVKASNSWPRYRLEVRRGDKGDYIQAWISDHGQYVFHTCDFEACQRCGKKDHVTGEHVIKVVNGRSITVAEYEADRDAFTEWFGGKSNGKTLSTPEAHAGYLADPRRIPRENAPAVLGYGADNAGDEWH